MSIPLIPAPIPAGDMPAGAHAPTRSGWPIGALERLFRWCLEQLLSSQPRQLARSKPWTILLQHGERGLDVFTRSGAGRNPGQDLVGTIGADDASAEPIKSTLRARGVTSGRVVLRLGPVEVLQRPIEVPIAAEDVLGQVLTHQLDRWSPWPAAETLMGHKIIARDAGSGIIKANVAFTSRAIVAAARQRARSSARWPM